MSSYRLLLLNIMLLAGCAHTESPPPDSRNIVEMQDYYLGYFADASQCSAAAMRHETILLPSPSAAGSIDIPLGYDADKFLACMEYIGRPVARADTSKYLQVSTDCLNVARYADHPDAAYANCIKQSDLEIEVLSH